MIKPVFAAAIITLIPIAGAGAAQAADKYGAIAFSPSTGSVSYANAEINQNSAESKAYLQCAENAGDCEIALWFRNACGALAAASNGEWGSWWGNNRKQAENEAMKRCKDKGSDCSVRVWACTAR